MSRVIQAVSKLGELSPRTAAVVLSLRESLKHRGARRLWRDDDGDWSYAVGPTTLVSPFLTLEPPEDHIARAANHWSACVRPPFGGTVIDVGGGLGEDALLFASWVGATGRVLSIEADPLSFRCLSKTIVRSGARAVLPLHLAVGASEGFTRINVEADILARRTNASAGVEVRQAPLDGLMDEHRLQQVDLLKMNIEGAEIGALEGAQALLARTRAVIISCHDFIADSGGDPSMRTRERVENTLREAGFVLDARPDRGAPWLNDIVPAHRA